MHIAKTTQCFNLLATAYRNMQNSMTWVKQYLDYTTGAVIRLNEALENTKKALETERCRIMDAVLAGQLDGQGDSSSSSNNVDILINEPPPPVYEAPLGEQNEENLPSIPSNLTPTSSLSNFPLGGDHSPLLPPANIHAVNVDNTVPPHPITPILIGDTNTSPSTTINNTANHNNMGQQQQHLQPQPYVSHNVNNPFQ
jgi:hypothetical protein